MTSEADLDRTLREFEELDQELQLHRARHWIDDYLAGLDLRPRERQGLESQLSGLERMRAKLHQGVIQIASFGMVSRGKSSLLNALLGEEAFRTGPTHGVTRSAGVAVWQPGGEPFELPGFGPVRLELIDTPGIDEVAGQEREELARRIATQVDLILFVIAGDITTVELAALRTLREVGKPMLLVFNKVDQFPQADRQAIFAKLADERLQGLISPEEIVLVAAAPRRSQPRYAQGELVGVELVSEPPRVEALTQRILELLRREGRAMLALNSLLYTETANRRIVERKLRSRDREAEELIWQFTLTKAIAVALNPVTLLDLVASLGVDVGMILRLASLYGLSLDERAARDLLKVIALDAGGLGAGTVLGSLGLGAIKGMLGLATPASGGAAIAPYVPVALTQAGIAGYGTYSVGQIAKQYLADGASWGSDGPRALAQRVLDDLDEQSVLARIRGELRQRLQTGRPGGAPS